MTALPMHGLALWEGDRPRSPWQTAFAYRNAALRDPAIGYAKF
jgi:hypothetical protein